MAKFKVGDRVRFIERYGNQQIGEEGIVTAVNEKFESDRDLVHVWMDKGVASSAFSYRMELVEAVEKTDEEVAVEFRKSFEAASKALKILRLRGYKVGHNIENGSAKISKTTVKEL